VSSTSSGAPEGGSRSPTSALLGLIPRALRSFPYLSPCTPGGIKEVAPPRSRSCWGSPQQPKSIRGREWPGSTAAALSNAEQERRERGCCRTSRTRAAARQGSVEGGTRAGGRGRRRVVQQPRAGGLVELHSVRA